jgi:hypothetical protein
MRKDTPQYCDIANGVKSKLGELLQLEDKLTKTQKQDVEHLYQEYSALSRCKHGA